MVGIFMEEGEKSIKFSSEGDVSQKFEELADALVADLEEGDQSKMESFESYSNRVRREIMDEMNEFKENFLLGYEVILSELAEKYSSGGKEDDVPPNAMKM